VHSVEKISNQGRGQLPGGERRIVLLSWKWLRKWDLSQCLKGVAAAEAFVMAFHIFDSLVNSNWRNADQTRYACMEFEEVAGQKSAVHRQANMEADCHKCKFCICQQCCVRTKTETETKPSRMRPKYQTMETETKTKIFHHNFGFKTLTSVVIAVLVLLLCCS